MQTTIFRQQHATIRQILDSLSTHADFTSPEVYGTLVRLTSVIRAHLKLEDEKLYPALAQSSDPEIREKAARFQKEMGALAPAYVAFAEKWMRSGAISENAAGFGSEWNAIVKALNDRMDREDNDLYAEFDRLQAA